MDDATSDARCHTPAGHYCLHLLLEQFTWHFSISFMVAPIMDVTLFILNQLLLLKGNYFTKAERQEQQSPARE